MRVLRAGICNTDLEIMKGYMGFSGVLGHEFVGIVEQFAEEGVPEQQRRRLAGKRVVGDINLACAECSVCARRNDRSRNHCPTRTVLGILAKDGTFAEYLTLPVVNLHLVPDGVTDEQAVFCEPLAAACRVVESSDLLLTMPETYARLLSEHARIAIMAPPAELPAIDVHLYWHMAYEREPALVWFRDQLKAISQ